MSENKINNSWKNFNPSKYFKNNNNVIQSMPEITGTGDVMNSRISGDLAVPPALPPRPKKLRKRDKVMSTWRDLPGFKKKKLTRIQAKRRIEFIRIYAQWLDRIPGQPIPIGIDGILGLVPGVGDISAGGLSLLMIYLARDLDLPKSIYNKMFINLSIDTTIGSIPLVGDIYDIWFKTNIRNLKIIEKWFEKNINLFEDDTDVNMEPHSD